MIRGKGTEREFMSLLVLPVLFSCLTHKCTHAHLCTCAHILTRGYYHLNWLGLCRNRKAMAKLKCSNAQHSYVGTIFSNDKLLA